MNSHLFAATAALLAITLPLSAEAQTHARAAAPARSAPEAATAPAVAAAPWVNGPPISGLCTFSNERTIGVSLVGKAFQTRLQQLRAQASAELSGEETALQADGSALNAKRASLTQEQLQQQATQLQQRSQALNQKADLRTRELQYSAQHALQRISANTDPILRSVYQQRHCSVLMNGDAIMVENPEMDITDAVVAGLNGKMSTITFDRESLPPGQQQQ